MQEEQKIYVSIDLKSFYASVECRERGLDPLTTNLVVADSSRTEKTICLAVSPALKKYGIPGRARLFEVVQKVKEINADRKRRAPGHIFTGKSINELELNKNSSLQLDYIAAPPRMAHYMQYSTQIYNVYLKYFAPEDIYVYSIDEVFCDVTHYLKTYNMTERKLVTKVIQDVYETTGITATAGIGTNMYVCKVAMDIVAKHVKPDKNGVRIAGLDEMSYRKLLWNHRPITDLNDDELAEAIEKLLQYYGGVSAIYKELEELKHYKDTGYGSIYDKIKSNLNTTYRSVYQLFYNLIKLKYETNQTDKDDYEDAIYTNLENLYYLTKTKANLERAFNNAFPYKVNGDKQHPDDRLDSYIFKQRQKT